jgi:hypothetical protein
VFFEPTDNLVRVLGAVVLLSNCLFFGRIE